MIERWVPAASTYAQDVDFLILLILALVGFWFLVSEGVFFWLNWRFRRKEGQPAQYVTGELKSEKRFITYPHLLVLVCDVFIIVFAVKVWYDVKQVLPEPDRTVRAIAQQWAWTFEHPGPDGKLDTADDITKINELHVQVGSVYNYELESKDVLHDFSVPVFRLKQDAIPGRTIKGWFEPTRPGVYDIQCAEICGIGHGLMGARIHIETPEQHTAWMAENTTLSLAAAAAPPRIEE
jgi:cytochrome c oxidase subunit 2